MILFQQLAREAYLLACSFQGFAESFLEIELINASDKYHRICSMENSVQSCRPVLGFLFSLITRSALANTLGGID